MARNDKKTGPTDTSGNSDESSIEEREAEGGDEEVTDQTDDSGEPIDGTQEVAQVAEEGDAPSWGYEEKKRRFSKEIAIAFLAITLLLGIGGFILWKGFFKPAAQPSPDDTASTPETQPPTSNGSDETKPETNNDSPYIAGNPLPTQPTTPETSPVIETNVASTEPDPFRDSPQVATNTPKPRGVFDPMPEERSKPADLFPASEPAVSEVSKQPAALPDFGNPNTEPMPELPSNDPPMEVASQPAFDPKPEPTTFEPEPQPVIRERSRPERTFVSEPQAEPEPVAGDFQAPRSTIAEPMSEPAMLEPMPTNAGSYVVKEGDNFWEISKKVYGIHGLYLALYEFNRSRVPDANLLKPGTTLETPEIESLRTLARSLDSTRPPKPEPRRRNVESAVVSTTVRRNGSAQERESGLFFDEEGLPFFRVGKNDTLRKIAADHLGRSERSKQIYKMNQDLLKNENDLRIGTELRLPRDASRAVLATQPAPDRY